MAAPGLIVCLEMRELQKFGRQKGTREHERFAEVLPELEMFRLIAAEVRLAKHSSTTSYTSWASQDQQLLYCKKKNLMPKNSRSLERFCLVTVGATVGFKELTESVLEPGFWEFLKAQNFTHLHIQCGPDIPWAGAKLATLTEEAPTNLVIEIFDVRKNLMKEEMILCKALNNQREEGLVISHAGMHYV